MERYSSFLFFPIAFILTFPIQATSQWSNDPHVNTIVATNAFEPKMVSDGSGGAIIVWWNGDDYGLHAQRLDKYGYARWGNNGVYLGGIGWYQTEYFSLCEDGNGGCVVAFDDIYTEYPTYYARIYAQRIDSLGNKLWGNVGTPVCDIDSIGVGAAHVVPDGLGGFFVTWSDRREPWLRVYGQHLDGNGNGTWVDNGICISGNSNFLNEYSALVPGGPGYCIAVWDHLYEPGDLRVVGQRLNVNGAFCWGAEGILLPEEVVLANTVTTDYLAGAIVSGVTSSGPLLYNLNAQRVDSSGVLLWGHNGVSVCDSLSSFWSDVANDSGIFFIWRSGTVGSFQVRVQRISYDGNPQWLPQGVLISDPQVSSSYPVINSALHGDIVTTWYELGQARFITQKLDINSNCLWPDLGSILSYNTDRYESLQAISDLSGGSILCWIRYPAILFAQQISANGNLGEVLAVQEQPPASIPAKITLLQNYPNPFNEGTLIPILIPQGINNNSMGIRIYNVLGQRIRNLDPRQLVNGINYLLWDGADSDRNQVASGWYFLEIQGSDYRQTMPMVKLK